MNKKEEKEETKVIILDNNPISIAGYAEEYPENWKKICEALGKEVDDDRKKKEAKDLIWMLEMMKEGKEDCNLILVISKGEIERIIKLKKE